MKDLIGEQNQSLDGKTIVWVTRSFLDYRVPVYLELHRLLKGRLYIVYSKEFTPERAWKKLEKGIGLSNAIGLTGERSFGYKGNITGELANSKLRFPFQPGLLKNIRELKPDILIGDGFFQWSWPAILYRLISRSHLVVCYERTKHTERNAQWYRTFFRKCMVSLIDSMCVNGRLSFEYVVGLGMSSALITSGHMVADTCEFARQVRSVHEEELNELRRALEIDEGKKIVLSVCRLVRRKGVHHLLLGWNDYFATSRKDSVLLIVGDGPERENLEQFCQSQGIGNVRYVGEVDYDSIYKYFAIADLFVISTLEDNWSLVVPEAMSCGKPILCSEYNGCWPELVQKGKNGRIFNPKDIGSIKESLHSCLELDNLAQMGEESRYIISNYTPCSAAESVYRACQIAVSNKNDHEKNI